jgi:GTPase SAR1 family protein
MADLVAVKEGLELAGATVSIAKNVGLIDRVLRQIKGTKNIVLLGCSGVGKTQFIYSLKNGKMNYVKGRDKTLIVRSIQQKYKEFYLNVYDTPGHVAREQLKKDLVRDLGRSKKGIGVINVVCNGYHINDDYSDQMFLEKQFLVDTISSNLSQEIEQLRIVNSFIDFTNVDWVITLVNKADLWINDNKQSTLKHYASGPYFEKLNKISIHEVIPYCSVIQDFYKVRHPQISEAEKDDVNREFNKKFDEILEYKR